MQPSKGLHNQVVKIVVAYCVYSKLLCFILNCAYTEHWHQKLVCALSIRVRNCGACTEHTMSGTNGCTERKFEIWKDPFKPCWAYASGTVRILSIGVRNWCVRWAYASGTDAYPEHTHHFLTSMLSSKIEKVLSNHAEHTCKEMMRALNVNVRNWFVCWAHQKLTDA
jgi:hypothetical protein